MAIMVPFEPTILDSVGSFENPKIAIVRLFCLQKQLVEEGTQCIGTLFTFNKKCITGRSVMYVCVFEITKTHAQVQKNQNLWQLIDRENIAH